MKLLLNSLLILFLAQFPIDLNAQSCFEEIKDLPVNFEELSISSLSDFVEFKEKLGCFIGDELDSVDILIFSDDAMLGSIIVSVVNEKEDNSELTYGNIYDHIVKMKNELGNYPRIRETFITSREIDLLSAVHSNWEQVLSFLIKIDVSEEDIETFRVYLEVNENPNKTMKELRLEYQQARMELYEEHERNRSPRNRKEQIERLLANSGPIDVESIIVTSISESKPIILYFTGYNCINCRKIEESVIKDETVLDILDDYFVFASLYVDDRSAFETSETFIVNGEVRVPKTVGDFNMFFQMSEFEVSTQPYFVVLHADGEILGSTNYLDSRTSIDFLQFLDGINY